MEETAVKDRDQEESAEDMQEFVGEDAAYGTYL
jgi:hypothetical protein